MPGEEITVKGERLEDEQRLRDRLEARKSTSHEARLRERLTSKSRRGSEPRNGSQTEPHRHHNHRNRRGSPDPANRRLSNDRRPYYDRDNNYDPRDRAPRRGSYKKETDDFGRSVRQRSRSRSRSPSYSDSSRSRSPRGRRSRSASSASSYSSRSSYDSRSSHSSSSSYSSSSSSESEAEEEETTYTKDQRTVFVNQLVMRTNERDVKRYLKKQGIKVKAVILLRDRRTGRHKGCAYVEMRRMEDVTKSLELSGKAPDFQRFPILLKPSEAEKNYAPASAPAPTTATVAAVPSAASASAIALRSGIYIPPNAPAPPRVLAPNGQIMESQRVYVGSLDPSVTAEHLYALFRHFGQLQKVALQMDSGISKGFAFLTFTDPKASCLAIQTLSGQVLAGRPIKTGWANHIPPTSNIQIVQADEFPADAGARAQRAFSALAQLNLGVHPGQVAVASTAAAAATQQPAMASGASLAGTVAEARASLAAASAATVMTPVVPVAAPPVAAAAVAPVVAVDATQIGNASHPTQNLIVHNMYDREQETDPNWQEDLRQEFQEECAKFGPIKCIKVLDEEPGGKIFCQFETGAEACAASLAGRWFDQRQLRVEYISNAAASAYRK